MEKQCADINKDRILSFEFVDPPYNALNTASDAGWNAPPYKARTTSDPRIAVVVDTKGDRTAKERNRRDVHETEPEEFCTVREGNEREK